jgi:alginate O-acetyltransferase complex protein AlgI
MGPVERSAHFAEDLRSLSARRWSHVHFRSGLVLVVGGLFAKLVLAERLRHLVDAVYAESDKSGLLGVGLSILAFPWQLYFDFLGYSLVALGLGRVLGFKISINFNRPFYAKTVAEFWQRWHISLSSWFQDYVYTPLRFMMRRKRTAGIAIATISSFTLIGIWHGNGMQFLVFGLLHGLMVTLETLTKKSGEQHTSSFFGMFQMARTYLLVACSLVLFRSSNITQVTELFCGLTRWASSDMGLVLGSLNKLDLIILSLGVPFVEALTWAGFLDPTKTEKSLAEIPTWLRWLLYASLLGGTFALGVFEHSPFIYAQF